MIENSTKVSAENLRDVMGVVISGALSNIATGWHTLTFDSPFPDDPVILVQGVGDNVTAEVKNITTSGFDYRGKLNGADADGTSVMWFAYLARSSENGVIDEINDLLSTDYASVSELISDPSGFADACANSSVVDILFDYTPAITLIASSEDAIDTVLGTSTSYSALSSHSAMKTAITQTTYGDAKLYYRTYSGNTDTSGIHSMSDVVTSSEFPTMCDNQGAMKTLFGKDSYMQTVCSTAQAMNNICKHSRSRYEWNNQRSRALKYLSNLKTALADTTHFSKTEQTGAFADFSSERTFTINKANPRSTSNDDSSGWDTADACVVFLSSASNSYDFGDTEIRTCTDPGGLPNITIGVDSSNVRNALACGGLYVTWCQRMRDLTVWSAK